MIRSVCPFCEITVKARIKAIFCDQCNKWIHIKCNNLNDLEYEDLKIRDESWYCKACIQDILPFCSKKVNSNTSSDHLRSIDPNLKKILCQLNNLSEQDTNNNENLPNCKHRDVSYFSDLDQKHKLKDLSYFHLNINSLSKKFDDFNHFINYLNLNFDFLGISESRILKSQSSNVNISLQNYLIGQTPTESTAREVLLYINKKHSYKTRPDLMIYKSKKPESTYWSHFAKEK